VADASTWLSSVTAAKSSPLLILIQPRRSGRLRFDSSGAAWACQNHNGQCSWYPDVFCLSGLLSALFCCSCCPVTIPRSFDAFQPRDKRCDRLKLPIVLPPCLSPSDTTHLPELARNLVLKSTAHRSHPVSPDRQDVPSRGALNLKLSEGASATY
jgi:hypothetical protein